MFHVLLEGMDMEFHAFSYALVVIGTCAMVYALLMGMCVPQNSLAYMNLYWWEYGPWNMPY